MLNSNCSLSLFREILSGLSDELERLGLYARYFYEINQQIGDQPMIFEELGLSEDYSAAE
jgi:hypothetical protein